MRNKSIKQIIKEVLGNQRVSGLPSHYDSFQLLRFVKLQITEYENKRKEVSVPGNCFIAWFDGANFFNQLFSVVDEACKIFIEEKKPMRNKTKLSFVVKKNNIKKIIKNYREEWEQSYNKLNPDIFEFEVA